MKKGLAAYSLQGSALRSGRPLTGESLMRRIGTVSVGELSVATDLLASIRKADLLYTDCWPRSENEDTVDRIREAHPAN